MIKILSFFFALFLTISMNAQYGIQKNRMAEAELIKELPLLVVMHEYDSPFYQKMNVMLKEAMEKYWTYSGPIEYVTKDELREISKDKSKKDKYAYLMYSEKVYQANVPSGVFCIGLLDKKVFTHFKSFGDLNKELTLADYKLGLYWLQKDLTLPFGMKVVNNRLKESIYEYRERVTQDTLLIDEDLFTEDLIESIPELYNYNYKIVSKEVIDKAILDESPNILCIKSLETLTRPITSSKTNSQEIGVGGNGNNNYSVTETKRTSVHGIVMNNIYMADNLELLIQIFGSSSDGKSKIKDFKRMLKAIE